MDRADTERSSVKVCKRICIIVTSLIMVLTATANAQVVLRINTMHGVENAKGAVLDAGFNLATDIAVSTSSQMNGTPFLPPDTFVEDAKTVGATILSSSFSNWNFIFDTNGYEKLIDNGMVHVFAYEPHQPQPWDAPPPAAFVTVNKIGGKSGGGIEFGVPVDYMHGKGKSDTPSGVTAQLAGLMACLKYSHPSWNWFDIKAALRVTASNYVTGYDPATYGYGAIDYYAANDLKDAAKLPLFPPAAIILRQRGDQITFAVNQFKQSRRYADVLFAFPSRPAPQYKELTLAEITAMGGHPVFVNLSSDSNIHTYQVINPEAPYFVWSTRDINENFSRIERYSIIGPVLQ